MHYARLMHHSILTSLGVITNKGTGLGKESQMVILMSGLKKIKDLLEYIKEAGCRKHTGSQ